MGGAGLAADFDGEVDEDVFDEEVSEEVVFEEVDFESVVPELAVFEPEASDRGGSSTRVIDWQPARKNKPQKRLKQMRARGIRL